MILALLLLQDVPGLVRTLGSGDAAARDAATAKLIELGDSATEALTAALESNDPEVRHRARTVLDSPYRGLGPAAVEEATAWEQKYDGLIDRLTKRDDAYGGHGPVHHLDEAAGAELWEHLKALPEYRGSSARLLGAIDRVYLSYHDNKWHGFVHHWPYLDCAKALELAERLAGEEGLWTMIYCYRVAGIESGSLLEQRLVGDPQFGRYPCVKALVKWKADPERVRALCEELIRNHPDGRYATRAKAILDGGATTLDIAGVEKTDPDDECVFKR